MGFYGIVKIDKAAQLEVSVLVVLKSVLACQISIRVRITRSALPLVCGRLTLVNFWPMPWLLQAFTKAWLSVPLYSLPLSE